MRALALLCLTLEACGGGSAAPDAAPADAWDCTYEATAADQAAPAPLHTPRWAFEPWISKDISDAADTRSFVQGFRDRDIPVGVVVLDSPWETHYNTFVPHPMRYPDFGDLVADLRQDGVRVVLWVTQMVNERSFDLEEGGDVYLGPSPNFDQGLACGYFIDDAATYFWWKGFGSGVDFMNPDATRWWHRQQDPLLELGVAGWKLDFGDSYVLSDPVLTAAGPIPHQAYSEAYYRDFYAYGAAQRGTDEFVTMVRPWDESYDLVGRFYARPEHAPVTWVGDNRRDWVGLADALDHTFRSAEAGYVVIGSDVGGYLDRDDKDLAGSPYIEFSQEVFARWTAVGAMTPFMQLHGRANITPWTVPERVDETVELYRYWATLHHQLVPFFYSLAEEAYAGAGPGMIDPQGGEAEWPGDYRFVVGGAFLVAPVLAAGGVRDVALPAGARWYDWWSPAADALAGGQTLAAVDASDRRRIPLYVREGAIVPLDVDSDVTGLGTAASVGHLTLLVWPAADESRFVLHEADDTTTEITTRAEATGAVVTLGRAVRPVLLRLRADAAPAGAELDGAPLALVADRAALDAAAQGWFYDAATRSAWIKAPAAAAATTIRVSP